MTTADRWILRIIGFGMIAVVGIVGYESFTNGEQFKRTQAALIASAKSGSTDLHSVSTAAVSSTTALNAAVSKAGNAVDSLNGVIQSTNGVIQSVDRPCGVASKPCGTLADVNRTLATVRGTFGQIETAANHENENLTKLDKQEDQLFADTHMALEKFSDSLDAATQTLNHGTAAVDSLNAVLRDQAIHQTAQNVADMTTIAYQVEAKATKGYLHPSHNPAKRVWDMASPFLVSGAKIAATVF